jgi:hypothetical protein
MIGYTSQTIQNQALYNIYGNTVADASVAAQCAVLFWNILNRVQRENDFFFSKQKKSFSTVAAQSDYQTALAIMGSANADMNLAQILSIWVTANGVRSQVNRIPLIDMDNQPVASGVPTKFSEIYQESALNQHIIRLYATPDAIYTVDVYIKEIFFPLDTTVIYASIMLDEMGEYLVAKLTSELSLMLDYSQKAQTFDGYAQRLLAGMITKSFDYTKQETGGRGVYRAL